jgi:hypothetical protein
VQPQVPLEAMQVGVSPRQSASFVHCPCGLQVCGVSLSRHWFEPLTQPQVPVDAMHTGVLPAQSVWVTHWLALLQRWGVLLSRHF